MKACSQAPLREDELRAIRERLLARQAELRDRVRRVHHDLGRQHEPLPADPADGAIVIENEEVLHAIEETAARELDGIELALRRIECNLFGVCDDCGRDIEAERLDVVPAATRCRACAPGS